MAISRADLSQLTPPHFPKKGTMPHTESRMQYTLMLTDQEFRLVTMALARMLVDEEDSSAALKLNTQLCHQRVVALHQAKEVAEKALEGASALENPNIPPYKAKK